MENNEKSFEELISDLKMLSVIWKIKIFHLMTLSKIIP